MTLNPSPSSSPSPAPRFAPWAAHPAAAIILVLAVLAARLIYLRFFCPYALIEDEAHYWEWSRHLDLSYYSKGPGIAWVIALSRSIFGDSEFAVRFPAAVSSAIAAWSVSRLSRDIFSDPRVPFFAATCFLLTPVYIAISGIGTIDGPYIACWALATMFAFRALNDGSWQSWIGLGLALAAGVLFKYTIVFLVPALVWHAVTARSPIRAGRAAVAAIIAIAGFAPILIWNSQHDWDTVRHLLGHVGAAGGDIAPGATPTILERIGSVLTFIGVQIALAGTVIALALNAHRGGASAYRYLSSHAGAYCVRCGLPLLVFYVCVSAVTDAEGNWPAAAYVTIAVLAGGVVVAGMDDYYQRLHAWLALPLPRPKAGVLTQRPETARQVGWHIFLAVGITVSVLTLRLDVLGRLPLVGAKLPVGRLTSARTVAADADRRVDELRRATGLEPFVVAQHYGRASQLAFYMRDRPIVYCASSRTGGRRTQYDLWSQTDLRDPALIGRPALVLGAVADQWLEAFDRVEPIGPMVGEHKRGRDAFIAFGYRGFAPPAPAATR